MFISTYIEPVYELWNSFNLTKFYIDFRRKIIYCRLAFLGNKVEFSAKRKEKAVEKSGRSIFDGYIQYTVHLCIYSSISLYQGLCTVSFITYTRAVHLSAEIWNVNCTYKMCAVHVLDCSVCIWTLEINQVVEQCSAKEKIFY